MLFVIIHDRLGEIAQAERLMATAMTLAILWCFAQDCMHFKIRIGARLSVPNETYSELLSKHSLKTASQLYMP